MISADDQAAAITGTVIALLPPRLEILKWVIAAVITVGGVLLLIGGNPLGYGAIAFGVLLGGLVLNIALSTRRLTRSSVATQWPVGSTLTIRATPSESMTIGVMGLIEQPWRLYRGLDRSESLITFQRVAPNAPLIMPRAASGDAEIDIVRDWIAGASGGPAGHRAVRTDDAGGVSDAQV